MKIVVYTKPGCQACTATKHHLDRLDIPYTEVNIMTDSHAAQRLREMSSLELPRVEVSFCDWHNSWTGYRPTKIEELLEKYEIGA